MQKEHEARLPLHPDHPERGYRVYRAKSAAVVSFMMPRKDLAEAGGKVIRLMGLMNMEVTRVDKDGVEAKYHSQDHAKARELRAPFIHWLLPGEGTPAEVMMPDASLAHGLTEKKTLDLKVSDIIQFERFGFVRVDSLDPPVFYYSHD